MNQAPAPDPRRDQFLLAMYREVWSNINRHITVVWQSSGVLAGAFALFALVDKGAFNVDIASALLVLIAAWLIAHTYDANAWFGRNLVIVANIERQFLRPSDEREIHCFFIRHREPGDVVEHLQVHRNMAVGVALIVLGYHIATRIAPHIGTAWSVTEFQRGLPYVTALLCIVWVLQFRSTRRAKYLEFVTRSPGAVLSSREDSTSSPRA